MPWTMVPVFSSIVTVSLVHFMRNLRRWLLSARPALVGPHVAFALQFSMRQALRRDEGRGAYLTSFMLAVGCAQRQASVGRKIGMVG